jgi:hypothetical protein
MNMSYCYVSCNPLLMRFSIEIAVKTTEKQTNRFVISLGSQEETGSDSGDF